LLKPHQVTSIISTETLSNSYASRFLKK